MLPVLLGLGALIGGALIVANWDDVVNWLRDFIPKLREVWKEVRDYIPAEARMYGDRIVEGSNRLMKIAHKLFYQEDGQWYEESTVRKVPSDKVPPEIRNRVSMHEETDITEEMEELLEMEI